MAAKEKGDKYKENQCFFGKRLNCFFPIFEII